MLYIFKMARRILTVFLGTAVFTAAVMTFDKYRNVNDFIDQRQPTKHEAVRVETTNQPYRAPTTNQPYRASTTDQPYREQTTNQPYRAPTTDQPYRAPTTDQPYRAPTTDQPYRAPMTDQPYREQTTDQKYRMPTINQALTNKPRRALGENQAPHPTNVSGLSTDKIYLMYSLGLADCDAETFNLSLAAESYYNVYQVLGDARVASGQFVRSYALNNLLVRNMCFTTRIFRLIIVSIASDFQDVIGDKLDDLEPELKEILPELPEGAEDLEAIAPELLTILLLKYIVFPILSNTVDNKYFNDFEHIVECKLKDSDSVYTFIQYIEEFAVSNPPPECSSLSDVSRVLSERVPAIPKTFSDNILLIITKLRNAFDLHGLLNETSGVNDLFNTLQPEFVEIIKAYGDIVSVKGFNDLIESLGIPLPINPNDFLQPDDPALKTIQEVMRQLIGGESPLKDFMDDLKGNSTMPGIFSAIYNAEY